MTSVIDLIRQNIQGNIYAFNYFQVDSSVTIIKRRIKKRISTTRLTYIQYPSKYSNYG